MPMHPTAQRAAERLLTDRVQFIDSRAGGTLNTTTYEVVLPAESILWEGPALMVTRASSTTEHRGANDIQVDEMAIRIPAGAPDAGPGSLVRVMEAADPELVGVELEVIRSATRSATILRSIVARRRVGHVTPG